MDSKGYTQCGRKNETSKHQELGGRNAIEKMEVGTKPVLAKKPGAMASESATLEPADPLRPTKTYRTTPTYKTEPEMAGRHKQNRT